VVRAVIMSEEFRTTFGEKVKRPFEMAVSAFRATGAQWPFDMESSDGNRILDYLESTGQGLFRHPTPDGYSDFKEDWLSTNPIMSTWRLIIYAVEDSNNDIRNLRIEETTPTTIRSAASLVDYWTDRILGRPLPEGEREAIIGFMADGRSETMDTLWNTDSNVGRRLRYMVSLILLSPSNFLR
jgi:hypothetical protein